MDSKFVMLQGTWGMVGRGEGGELEARGEAQTRQSEARRHLEVDLSKKNW